MGSVRVKEQTNRLFLDFRFLGVRCREFTTLEDTPANRQRVEKLMKRVDREIALGTFNYRETFPGSPRADRFDEIKTAAKPGLFGQSGEIDDTARFRAFAETWVSEMSPTWRPSYEDTVIQSINAYLLPKFGNKTVASIKRADILGFRAELSKITTKNGNPLSAARINKVMGFLRMILNEAADRFEYNRPYTGIKPLKQKKPDIEPFSLQEVNQIIEAAPEQYRFYFAVRFWTGLRTGEVNALTWDRIDFDNDMILVRETLVKGKIQEGTKTYESSRDIPMLEPVRQALLAQRERVPEHVDWVFPALRGGPICNQNFCKRVWAPLLEELGLKHRRPYQTRHTAATLMLAAGESPEWIAHVLGHTTTEMLFRTYSRFVPHLTRRDGSAMAKLLAAQSMNFSTQALEEATVDIDSIPFDFSDRSDSE
jgi:integrase